MEDSSEGLGVVPIHGPQSLCRAALVHRESPEEKKLFNDEAFVDPKESLPFHVTTPSNGTAMERKEGHRGATASEL